MDWSWLSVILGLETVVVFFGFYEDIYVSFFCLGSKCGSDDTNSTNDENDKCKLTEPFPSHIRHKMIFDNG
jgi:hypothetical protein